MTLPDKRWNQTFVLMSAVLFLRSGLQAQEKCSVEIKLSLSPPTIQNVIASLNFANEQQSRVYFFDTDELNLLMQGVIVRVRQGAVNDLTVKVRVPKGGGQMDSTHFRAHVSCEINMTGAGEDTDYSVGRKYKPRKMPETGTDILSQLRPPQKKLLQEAGISIDWAAVRRIADINATKWESPARSPFGKLALEYWECSAGNILELSTKGGPNEGQSKYAELQRLANIKNLSLNATQGTKTSIVLETLTHH
jgi:hypothetical protein